MVVFRMHNCLLAQKEAVLCQWQWLMPNMYFAQTQTGENNTGADACNLKFKNASHPDLHFAFPVTTSDKVKSQTCF